MSLFGHSEEKAAKRDAAQAEADRLCALAPSELAAALLPAFAPGADGQQARLDELQLAMWAMASFKGTTKQTIQLRAPIREALQRLEHAELLVRSIARGGGWLTLTELGTTAIAEGSVARHISGPPS